MEKTKEAAAILKELRCPFIINQRRYSLLDRSIEKDGLKAYAKKHGIGIIAFCPLEQGLLTDRYAAGIPTDSRVRTDGRFLKEADITSGKLQTICQLSEIAKGRGQSLAQMALSWVLRDHEVTSVLIGASKPSQITENIKIVGHTNFAPDELETIERICQEFNVE